MVGQGTGRDREFVVGQGTGNLSAAGTGSPPAQGMSWALGRSNICYLISALSLSSACAPFLLDPNSSEGFLKSIFPLADEPISALAMKGVHFRGACPVTSDQKAK